MASPGGYYYGPPPRRRSIAGPLLLIAIGVIFLMRNLGFPIPIFEDFARWWPLLLLVLGLVRLAEYFYARSSGHPTPYMGGGAVFLMIVIICAGLSMSAWVHGRDHIHLGSGDDFQLDDNFLHLFGDEYSYNGELSTAMPENGALRVNCERGNVTVNQWDQPQIKVEWRKRMFASSQREADSTNESTTPRLQTNGTVVDLQGNTQGAGKKGVATDMDIYLPAKANVEVYVDRGEVNINQRTGYVKLAAQRGDVVVDQITGDARLTVHKGSLHATNIGGSVTLDGRLDDLMLDTIGGTIQVNADIFGDTHLGRLQKGIAIRTSRTTLEIAKLDGELSMDSGDLKANDLVGPVTLTTRTKDVEIQNIKGDLHINDDHGDITLENGSAAALGNLDLTTHHGDVQLRLPSKANFQYALVTRHGDITNDFGGSSSSSGGKSGNSSSASGTVGKGGVSVRVTSDTGNITFSKTEQTLAPPAPPATPEPPAQPEKPHHGKGKKKIDQVEVM